MAFQIDEKWESGNGQTGTSPQDEIRYRVIGTAADNASDGPTVHAWMQAQMAAFYNGRMLLTLERERTGDYSWLFIATYGLPTNGGLNTGDQSFEFNTTGGMQHFTAALQHVATYGPGNGSKRKTSMDGFINPGSGSDAAGTDAELAGFGFTARSVIPSANMTTSYVRLLYNLTYTVNANSIEFTIAGVPFEFDAGEVLFCGATGSIRTVDQGWEISLNFKANPNVTNKTIGSGTYAVSGIAVKGFEYVSVRTKCASGTDSNAGPNESSTFTGPVIDYVFVDQLYPVDNWTGLVPAAPPSGIAH